MTQSELLKAQNQILAHVGDAGTLSDVANVVIRFVYRLSQTSYFQHMNCAASEWQLRPKSWITLYLSTGRNHSEPKIIISIDLWPQAVPSNLTRLTIRQGRKPQWSKFTISDVRQVKDTLSLIEYTAPKATFPDEGGQSKSGQ